MLVTIGLKRLILFGKLTPEIVKVGTRRNCSLQVDTSVKNLANLVAETKRV